MRRSVSKRRPAWRSWLRCPDIRKKPSRSPWRRSCHRRSRPPGPGQSGTTQPRGNASAARWPQACAPPRPLPRQGLAEGSTSYVALSEPDVHGQPEATPVLDELVIVVGDRLVEQVIDTRTQHYVLVYVIRAAQIHEGIRRRHKRLARRRRGGGVAFLAAELQARPQIQVRSRLPIQADVEHVLGQLVQRLPCVLARFLLRVRVGVCRV